MNTLTKTKEDEQPGLGGSTCSAKIVQLLIAPNDATWQGVLLGLGSDGVTYHCKTGHWEPYIPELGYVPNAQDDRREAFGPSPC